LPPWWKYGFLLSIVWAIGYFSYYHVFGAAPLSAGEYANAMEEAKVAKEAYMRTAKNNIDENTIVFDAGYVADGQKIFTENCVPCHGPQGQGVVGIGPNLTDDYWLHGGKINDVFKSVKYGWPANGMKSWQADFSATQIAQVVCYVKSLKGTKPENPKAPQGELYIEDGGANKDSSAATASTAVKDTISK
jgi:cytochrome c oxidase cbb3-type subunit 3